MLSFIRDLFLPHPSNNHRAELLHPRGITFLLSFLTVTQMIFLFVSRVRPDVLGFATDISAQRLLELTNQKRLENGISPLSLNQELSQAAAGKANDMFGNNYWAHISPSGKSPWDFIIGAGYQYVYAGENLAKDFQDTQGVVDAWMNSPSHRDNLLQAKYKDVGFTVVNGRLNGEETTLVVQMFGTKSPQTLAQEIENQPSQITPTISLPSPTISPILLPLTKTTIPKFSTPGSIVKKIPKINLFFLSKDFSIALVLLLIAVLIIDAYIVSRQRIVRISGNNLAHILLLLALCATILLLNRGSIL